MANTRPVESPELPEAVDIAVELSVGVLDGVLVELLDGTGCGVCVACRQLADPGSSKVASENDAGCTFWQRQSIIDWALRRSAAEHALWLAH